MAAEAPEALPKKEKSEQYIGGVRYDLDLVLHPPSITSVIYVIDLDSGVCVCVSLLLVCW